MIESWPVQEKENDCAVHRITQLSMHVVTRYPLLEMRPEEEIPVMPVICWFSKYIYDTLIPWGCSSYNYLEVENHFVLTPPPPPPKEKKIKKHSTPQKS